MPLGRSQEKASSTMIFRECSDVRPRKDDKANAGDEGSSAKVEGGEPSDRETERRKGVQLPK